MQRRIKLHIGVLFIFLVSCQEQTSNSIYQNETTKSFLDSINRQYTNFHQKYYENGSSRLLIGQKSINKVIHSIKVEFYKNGTIEKIVHYKNDNREGNAKSFYPNGVLKTCLEYINGYKVGNAYYYYGNGVLKAYNSFDLAGSDFYVVLFDSTGHITRDTGNLISENIGIKLDTLANGRKSYLFYIFIACHPAYIVNAWVGQFSITRGIYDLKKYKLSGNSILVALTKSSGDRSKLVTIGEFLDRKTMQVIKRDTAVFEF